MVSVIKVIVRYCYIYYHQTEKRDNNQQLHIANYREVE